jgi:chromosomal replication initiator protein
MGGLTVDIQPPDFETRSAIIIQKSQEKNVVITPDAIDYLASNIESNIRDIEGKIQELAVISLSKSISIDQKLAQDFLSGHQMTNSDFSPKPSAKVSGRHLISICAKYFNLRTTDLVGNSRKKELVTARHITAYLLLTYSNLPLSEVGHLLGGRDHTSIMHARDKISTDYSTNPQTRDVINQIKSQL